MAQLLNAKVMRFQTEWTPFKMDVFRPYQSSFHDQTADCFFSIYPRLFYFVAWLKKESLQNC